MKKMFILLAAVLVLGFVGSTMAQGSDNHTVTVTINAVNLLDVDANVTLVPTTATAGATELTDDDNSANLTWTSNAANRDIMVKYSADVTDVELTVEAQNVTNTAGTSATPTAAGEITLTTSDQDFITGAGKCSGTADLYYTATASLEASSGSTTVTYTITAS